MLDVQFVLDEHLKENPIGVKLTSPMDVEMLTVLVTPVAEVMSKTMFPPYLAPKSAITEATSPLLLAFSSGKAFVEAESFNPTMLAAFVACPPPV